jgi:uncharacterized protein (TIGR00251 family)
VLEPHPSGVVISVRAQPGARRAGICGEHGGRLKVAVTQVAEKGKANAALIEVLADELGLRRSQLQLLSGQTSREKCILVRGLDQGTLQQRIEAALDQARAPRRKSS